MRLVYSLRVPIENNGLMGLGPSCVQCRLGRGLPPFKWHLDPTSRLASKDMRRKLGAVPLSGAGSPANTMWHGSRPTSVASGILIHLYPFCHSRHGPKRGQCCYAPLGGAASPSNTMWPGPRPTSVASDILIHLPLWPQYMGRKVGGGLL